MRPKRTPFFTFFPKKNLFFCLAALFFVCVVLCLPTATARPPHVDHARFRHARRARRINTAPRPPSRRFTPMAFVNQLPPRIFPTVDEVAPAVNPPVPPMMNMPIDMATPLPQPTIDHVAGSGYYFDERDVLNNNNYNTHVGYNNNGDMVNSNVGNGNGHAMLNPNNYNNNNIPNTTPNNINMNPGGAPSVPPSQPINPPLNTNYPPVNNNYNMPIVDPASGASGVVMPQPIVHPEADEVWRSPFDVPLVNTYNTQQENAVMGRIRQMKLRSQKLWGDTKKAVHNAYNSTTSALGHAYDSTSDFAHKAYDATADDAHKAYDTTTGAVADAYHATADKVTSAREGLADAVRPS